HFTDLHSPASSSTALQLGSACCAHSRRKKPCPLYPRKRTCAVHKPRSALGHKRTSVRKWQHCSVTRSETSVSVEREFLSAQFQDCRRPFATAASILSLEVPKYLHQCRVSSLLDISTRFRTALVREVIRML